MSYLSVIIYISMITDFNELVNGSSLLLPAHRWVGTRAIPFIAELFAKQKTKFGVEKRGRPRRRNFRNYRETISLLKEIGHIIDRVSLSRFFPLPGPFVFKNAKTYGLNIPEHIEDWDKFHIYRNHHHWWGDNEDFRQVENSYEELNRFVEETWR